MPATPAADEIGDIFGFPSAEADRARQAFTPEQGPGRRPEVPLNLGFGAGTFTSNDFAGFNTGNPTVMDPFYVSGGSINPYGADLSGFNYYMPGFGYTDFFVTPGAGENFGGGLLGRPAGTSTPTILDPYTVTGTRINDPSLLGIDPNAPYLGPRAPFQIDPTEGGAGVVTLPPVVVKETALGGTGNLNLLGYDPNASFVGPVANPNATTDGETVTLPPFVVTDTKDKVSTEQPNWFRDYIAGRTTSPTPVYMNPYFVKEPKVAKPDENVTFVDPFQTATNKNAPRVGDLTLVDDTTKTKKDDSTKIDLGGNQPAGGGGGSVATGTGGGTTGARRNIGAELKETMAALQANEPAITSMYKGLYESFMPDTLRTAASSGLSQLRSDEEKLARLRAGILSPEDVRTAQQGAREAYAARGQVMGPGAVGAEILNRENIRQSREDAARAAYNQSIGNVLNTANLQTGNIFQPIGNLISGTFNPLGSYPADVYGTNVNADLATMISDKNYAAAIESAKLAGAAGKSAATTSALGDIFGAVLPSIFKALPFCWVAREVYGVDNPKWLQFRTWMFTQAPGWFFRWYMDNGERFADWLRRNPWMKPAIRFWMDSRIRSMENQIILKEAF